MNGTAHRPDRNALPATRIKALEPLDCQGILPPWSDRNLGPRHPQDCWSDARSRVTGTYLAAQRRLRDHAFILPSIKITRTNGGGSGKMPVLFLHRLAEAPITSIPELAQHLGKSESAIERAIRKLRANGNWHGPAKGGHWERRRPARIGLL